MFSAPATARLFAVCLMSACALGMPASAQSPDRRLTVGQPGERRVALVIGNDTYASAPLRNARNDARAVATALRDVGFTVTEKSDLRRSDFGAELEAFARGLTTNDVALFYFAGHGLQVENENYLLPVDFSGQSASAARWDTIPVGRVHDVMRNARVSMIVLDACRNNPFNGARTTGGGLAAMEARGSLIAFAAGAGQTASDNTAAANGLFTTHLLATLRTPGLGVREVFRRTRELVVSATNGNQFPAVYDGLVGEFVFRVVDPPAVAEAPRPVAPGPGGTREDLDLRVELAMWESVNQVQSPNSARTMLEDFIRVYPTSRFRSLALAKLIDARAAIAKADVRGAIQLRVDQLLSATAAELVANCDAGLWAACSRAAVVYRDGIGVSANAEQSLRLAARGCAMGDLGGCNVEGYAYRNAVGVERDFSRAAWLYQRVCDGRVMVGCTNLGLALLNGEGMAADKSRAIALFREACPVSVVACSNLGAVYERGDGVARSDQEAAIWYEKACAANGATGCRGLGRLYEAGRGVPADRSKAIESYRTACAGKDEPSCAALKRLGGD